MSFFCEECGLEWASRRNQDSVEADVCHKCIDEYEPPTEEEEEDDDPWSGGYRTWGKEISYEEIVEMYAAERLGVTEDDVMDALRMYSGNTDTFSVKPYTPPQPKVSVDAEAVDGKLKIHSVDVDWVRP